MAGLLVVLAPSFSARRRGNSPDTTLSPPPPTVVCVPELVFPSPRDRGLSPDTVLENPPATVNGGNSLGVFKARKRIHPSSNGQPASTPDGTLPAEVLMPTPDTHERP